MHVQCARSHAVFARDCRGGPAPRARLPPAAAAPGARSMPRDRSAHASTVAVTQHPMSTCCTCKRLLPMPPQMLQPPHAARVAFSSRSLWLIDTFLTHSTHPLVMQHFYDSFNDCRGVREYFYCV